MRHLIVAESAAASTGAYMYLYFDANDKKQPAKTSAETSPTHLYVPLNQPPRRAFGAAFFFFCAFALINFGLSRLRRLKFCIRAHRGRSIALSRSCIHVKNKPGVGMGWWSSSKCHCRTRAGNKKRPSYQPGDRAIFRVLGGSPKMARSPG